MSFEFIPQSLQGIVLIHPLIREDERGFFMETYKESEFRAAGIPLPFVQDNQSRSSRGVLRGLHYQVGRHQQGKLVRVLSGVIWDVALDIRQDSPTWATWFGIELSEANRHILYVPPGFAHGFITISERADVVYKCTAEHHPQSERGIRWDDPRLKIAWPLPEPLVSGKDAKLPTLEEAFPFVEEAPR